MTHRKPSDHAKKVGLILLRILILAAIFHLSVVTLDHFGVMSHFGRDAEITVASIADHFAFGWD